MQFVADIKARVKNKRFSSHAKINYNDAFVGASIYN